MVNKPLNEALFLGGGTLGGGGGWLNSHNLKKLRGWVLPPPSMPVTNEGLVCNNPGGDWHTGQGDNPT